MIRLHQFNTDWWGKPVGIIEDAAFFLLPAAERNQALAEFDWVEVRTELTNRVPSSAIHEAGFFAADTQVEFRIGLSGGERTFPQGIELISAEDPGWSLDASCWAPFEHERFSLLPRITPERLLARYRMWALSLADKHPEHCFQILYEGGSQAWFLGGPISNDVVDLTLSVRRENARISGHAVYQAALAQYANLGFRIGQASFSIRNTGVHNIYAKLGARFRRPTGIWLWCREFGPGLRP